MEFIISLRNNNFVFVVVLSATILIFTIALTAVSVIKPTQKGDSTIPENIEYFEHKPDAILTFEQDELVIFIEEKKALPVMACNDIPSFEIYSLELVSIQKYKIPAKFFIDYHNEFDIKKFETFGIFIVLLNQYEGLKLFVDKNQNDSFITYNTLDDLTLLDIFAQFDGDLVNSPLSPRQLRKYKVMASEIQNSSPEFTEDFNEFYTNVQNLIALNYKHISNEVAFNINVSPAVIAFFEVSEIMRKFTFNKTVNDLQEQYNVPTLLQQYQNHYYQVVSLNEQLAIDTFKSDNYEKLPNNNDDVCFVRIPKDVRPDYSVIGLINFEFSQYNVDAYNCNVK